MVRYAPKEVQKYTACEMTTLLPPEIPPSPNSEIDGRRTDALGLVSRCFPLHVPVTNRARTCAWWTRQAALEAEETAHIRQEEAREEERRVPGRLIQVTKLPAAVASDMSPRSSAGADPGDEPPSASLASSTTAASGWHAAWIDPTVSFGFLNRTS
jgi:hypothetical protein